MITVMSSSEATSHPSDVSGPKQKNRIHHKKQDSWNLVQKYIKIHSPYYNGGVVSALANYPIQINHAFFASGRLAFYVNCQCNYRWQ
jgi:hypothetical protein